MKLKLRKSKKEKHELKPGDVKIVSKEEAFWNNIKEKSLREVEMLEGMLKFNYAVLELANVKIENAKKQ